MASASLQPELKASIRGPLRYSVSISSPQIEAGRPFSVFVRITNPYDVPAQIIGVNTRLPVEFVDMESLRRIAEKQKLSERLGKLVRQQIQEGGGSAPEATSTEPQERVRKVVKVMSSLLPILGALSPFGTVAAAGGALVASSITATTLKEREDPSVLVEDLLTPADIESIVKLADQKDSPAAIYDIASKRLHERLRTLEASQNQPVTLQPGNSIVQVFTLRTTRAILFSPSTYNLHIQSEYKIDGAANQDSVEYQLNVRAPLQALIIGSIIGSVSGFLLRSIFNQQTGQFWVHRPPPAVLLPWIIALIGNILLGAIVVIAFARKKDAQPILAIEDFWGGVFVGVLAGYSGKSLLDQFFKTGTGAG